MIRLRVNGTDRMFDGDPATPLLWYLRDELALTGTKFGCGMALCGACTVHLDGHAVRACILGVGPRPRPDGDARCRRATLWASPCIAAS